MTRSLLIPGCEDLAVRSMTVTRVSVRLRAGKPWDLELHGWPFGSVAAARQWFMLAPLYATAGVEVKPP